MRRVENHLNQRTAGLIHQCACNWDFKWSFMTPFKRFKWKTFSNVSIPALAARAPERKVGPKLTITLANLHQIVRNCNNFSLTNSFTFSLTCFLDNPLAYSFTNVIAPFLTRSFTNLPDHEEAKGHALGAVLDQEGDVLIVLLRQNGCVVQDNRQEIHLEFWGIIFWRINFFLVSSWQSQRRCAHIGSARTLISFAWLDIHECHFILLRNGLIGKENIRSVHKLRVSMDNI